MLVALYTYRKSLYTYRKKKITVSVGAIAGCALIVLVGATLGYVGLHHRITNLSGPSHIPAPSPLAASSSPGASPTSRCPHPLAITSPANGTKIAHGTAGVIVKITACGLGAGEVGWLFDYDTGDDSYNFDGNGGAIVTTDGESTFADSPIGNSGDINKLTIITLVLANASCNQALTELQSGPPPTILPTTCLITSQINVYVTYP